MKAAPTVAAQRIETLDVVRGFALLGILLLNILSFALPSHLYFSPVDVLSSSGDLATWAVFEIGAEGAMRCLFSILFGAGVLLFLDPSGGKTGRLHYRRTFWLMIFGLFDILLLLWVGDILLVYALAGFVLYWVRNVRASRLLSCAVVLIILMSLQYAAMNFGISASADAAVEVAGRGQGNVSDELLAAAQPWQELQAAYHPEAQAIAAELGRRNTSFQSAFGYAVESFIGMVTFVIPLILFWDALAMMLLGMALYKFGVLQGDSSKSFYWSLAGIGFVLGLSINSLEAYGAYRSGFALTDTFPQMQWTYHFGRLGMAMGYLGLLVLVVKYDVLANTRRRLAAVGRMALTNYLSHSLICMLLFTGAGLGLAGEFSRTQVYGFVLAIWLLQLWFSPWWLQRYRFGPVEWLWRGLTYGFKT